MNRLYEIRDKGRVAILMIAVFALVVFSSYTYNKNIDQMGDLFSEMYSDRLMAQDHIYNFGKILLERKFNMAGRDPDALDGVFRRNRSAVLSLLNNYEKTKLTRNEKLQFGVFKKNVLLMLAFEQNYLLSPDKNVRTGLLKFQREALDISLVQLDKLEVIQTSTGKQLNEESKQIVTFSSLLEKIDWAIIIIIGLIIQVIIFTSRSSVPKEIQNQFLN